MTNDQTHTPSPTATQLFNDMVALIASGQQDAAHKLAQDAYAHARATGGQRAELDLREDVLRLLAPSWSEHAAETIDQDTAEAFKPLVEACNLTLDRLIHADTQPTQWTGEAAVRGLVAVMDSFQKMVTGTASRTISHTDAGLVLRQIPLQLAVTLSRALSEAAPAILTGMKDKDNAQYIASSMAADAQITLTCLMQAHSKMKSDIAQILEMQEWGGLDAKGSDLLKCVASTLGSLGWLNTMSKKFAPDSNPQGDMMLQEVDVHFEQLKATLRACAGC
ncbi:MAG TPA: hypothetical protein PKH72_13380 [Rhodoferax sp.]|jgi:hypothetical protein|nr:hypothetical protein [Rhodoferax sp.]HNV60639.1 hypothetical protein [Rhodoferax sp.]HPW27993.1 hypothetical protein [Rhodoferax sp.]